MPCLSRICPQKHRHPHFSCSLLITFALFTTASPGQPHAKGPPGSSLARFSCELCLVAVFCIWVFFFFFAIHREEREVMNPQADVRAGLTSPGEGAMLPAPARSLKVGKTGARRALLRGVGSAHPFLSPPGPARWLLHRPAVPSHCSIPPLHPTAPSRLSRPPCRSRLLWQVACLADGNDHVLGLAVPAPRRLRHLAHLIDAVADAVDVALVAVVIWAGAEDPVWRREKHKTSLWLPPAGPRIKAGWEIAAPHYILPLSLGVHPPGESLTHPCPSSSLQSPSTGVSALPSWGLVFRLLVSGISPGVGQ